MAKHLVLVHTGLKKVVIALDGYQPVPHEGYTEVGSFDFDTEPSDAQLRDPQDLGQGGDHPFIVKAKEILLDAGATEHDLKSFTFVDQATNATDTDETADLSTEGMEPIEGDNSHPEASTQSGGEVNSQTGEHRAGSQEAGKQTEAPPSTQQATGDKPQADADADKAKAEKANKAK